MFKISNCLSAKYLQLLCTFYPEVIERVVSLEREENQIAMLLSTNQQRTPKILVVEDDPLIAEDIADLLERANYIVVDIAYKAARAMELLRLTTPDLVLLDINLHGELSGIDLAHFINENLQIPFIYITSFSDRDTIKRVRETHPMGYLVKPFNEQSLYATLEIALANFAQFQKNDKLVLSLDNLNKKLINPLTEREFDTLLLLLEGKSNKQIANELFVSTNTIKTHLSNIFTKLDVGSRSKAILHVNQMFGH